MSIKILYYTRSNTTRRIAEKLAKKLECSTYQITDDKNWSGLFGYLKAGYYASTNKTVNISYDSNALEADQIIVLSPLWAGGPTPAVRTLLKEEPNLTPSLILTNDGSDINKAFEKTKTLFPRLVNFFGITKKMDHEEEMIERIALSMKS